MRITGEISDPLMKITVLEMNSRTSIKFEFDSMEQTYKLNDNNEGYRLDEIEGILTGEFRTGVMNTFKTMSQIRKGFDPQKERGDTEFPRLY